MSSFPIPTTGLTALVQTEAPFQTHNGVEVSASLRKVPDEDPDRELLQLALDRFQLVMDHEGDYRRMAQDEIDFVYNKKHWSEAQLKERAGRPCLSFDLIGPSIQQVINTARQSPPEPRVSPVGNGADKDTAEIIQGLIRNIDNDSRADIAYLTAYEHAVGVGRGWWRVTFEYENDLDFAQKILIKRIANPFTVYADPAAMEFDYSDMDYCFVTADMDEEVFKKKYPTSHAASGEFSGIGDKIKSEWYRKGVVRIAEYWWVEKKDKYICQLPNGTVVPWDQVPQGVIPTNTRTVESRQVKCAKITANDVLEITAHPGKWIPIVPCLGQEILRDKKLELRGMIRAAVDANLAYDYARTKQIEAVALTPLAPWLVAEGQIDGYAHLYADANRKAISVLPFKTINPDNQQPYGHVPHRDIAQPEIQAVTECVIYAKQDAQSELATYNPSLGAPSPEASGRAIRARQQESDNAHFNYHDNLARSIRHTGRIVIDLIPKVYSEARLISISDPDGNSRAIPINQEHIYQGAARIYDLKNDVARYDVTISSGPSYATRRQMGVEAFLELAKAMPEVMQRAADLGVRAMDIPMADKIADRLRPPDIKAEDDKNTPLPPQAMQAIQQLQQLNQSLTQAVHVLSDKIERQVLKLESDERRTAMQVKGAIIAADIKAGSDAAKTASDIAVSGAEQRLQLLHNQITVDAEAAEMERQRAHELETQEREHAAQLEQAKVQQQSNGGAGGGS